MHHTKRNATAHNENILAFKPYKLIENKLHQSNKQALSISYILEFQAKIPSSYSRFQELSVAPGLLPFVMVLVEVLDRSSKTLNQSPA